ncbi:MAG: GNAT family N-acetyltransferase [Sphingomicrobium sp.]
MAEFSVETERLVLREWREQDRDLFLAMCNSPVVMEHLGGPATAAEIDAGIARIRACQREHSHCFWAIERRRDGAFLGFCGLKRANDPGLPIAGEVEIGWRLREDAWGQGYAREAAEGTLAWGWANLDVSQIVAITVPANRRSRGLMERLGMARRPDLDFAHPRFAPDHPLSRHITYVIERP